VTARAPRTPDVRPETRRHAMPAKPQDVTNPGFRPVSHDRAVDQQVLAFNTTADDTLSVSVADGTPFFRISQLVLTDLVLEETDPGEVPGHPTPIRFWAETSPVASGDGSTPLRVTTDQRLHVSVTLDVPEHRRSPGPLSGTLLVQGAAFRRSLEMRTVYLAVNENSPIGQRWRDMGGDAFFGAPQTNEHPDSTGPGEIQEFDNGILYQISGHGVVYFTRDAFSGWSSVAPTGDVIRDAVGLPLEDTITRPDGVQVQRFQFGAVVVPAGGFA